MTTSEFRENRSRLEDNLREIEELETQAENAELGEYLNRLRDNLEDLEADYHQAREEKRTLKDEALRDYRDITGTLLSNLDQMAGNSSQDFDRRRTRPPQREPSATDEDFEYFHKFVKGVNDHLEESIRDYEQMIHQVSQIDESIGSQEVSEPQRISDDARDAIDSICERSRR
jgi:DNA repair exonuclease SbcCD ATPase subunit